MLKWQDQTPQTEKVDFSVMGQLPTEVQSHTVQEMLGYT